MCTDDRSLQTNELSKIESLNLPICNELINFTKKKYLKFFMPGHGQLVEKDDYNFTQKKVFEILKEFEKNTFKFDVTEVNDFDNLYFANGIIKKSLERLSSDFCCENVQFLLNGSTVGILTMITAVTKYEDKIIVQKNSHKSVFNSCKLNNLNIVLIENKKNDQFDVYNEIDLDYLNRLILENKDAKAVLITSPDYYGQLQNIKSIYELTKKYGMRLLLDSAHAAHYNYSSKLPELENNCCDAAVYSFHKTLPCINQTGVLIYKNEISQEINKQLSIFQTTSPSYFLMANIEIINYIMEKYGNSLYDNLFNLIEEFKYKISLLNYELQNKNLHIDILKNTDFTRIVFKVSGIDIKIVYDLLTQNNIFPEMINEKSIVLICNIFHTQTDFNNLLNILGKLKFIKKYKNKNSQNYKIYKRKNEFMNYLINNLNKINKINSFLYPPGTPFILVGEKITQKHIKTFHKIINNDEINLVF